MTKIYKDIYIFSEYFKLKKSNRNIKNHLPLLDFAILMLLSVHACFKLVLMKSSCEKHFLAFIIHQSLTCVSK